MKLNHLQLKHLGPCGKISLKTGKSILYILDTGTSVPGDTGTHWTVLRNLLHLINIPELADIGTI